MIWKYGLSDSNELQASDAHSLIELQRPDEKVNWRWIDCMEPDDEELETIAELVRDTEITRSIKKKQIFSFLIGKHLIFK